jgi:hypothetical protein
MKKEKFACLCLRFGIETQGYKYSETTRNIAKTWNKNIIVLFDARNKPIKTPMVKVKTVIIPACK